MAHQESVLSPETDLLILMPARPYTALLMTLCCECVCTVRFLYYFVHWHEKCCLKILSHLIPAGKLTHVVSVYGWSERQMEWKRDLREWRATNKGVRFLSPSSLNCPVVAVGGVGLSEVGAAVMKDISRKTQTGHRLLIDHGNRF